MDGKKEKSESIPIKAILAIDKMCELAYKMIEDYNKISVILLMKKFLINEEMAKKICLKVWLKQHLEARLIAKYIEMR